MRRLGVIVCNSGRGHLKRVLWVLRKLLERAKLPLQVDIFVNKEKLLAFETLIAEINGFSSKVYFHDIKAGVIAYEEEFLKNYAHFFKEANYIWSDNLVFPVKHHPNVFLTGQFLWADVVDNEIFVNNEKSMLRQANPPMIGVEYFATPNVRELTRFIGVGHFNYLLPSNEGGDRRGILLACGGTEEANVYFNEQLNEVLKKVGALADHALIFVEPLFWDRFPRHKNIQKALFSDDMYSQVAAAVIRPGMGTICDCLAKRVKIFSFYEEGNFELAFNSQVLKERGVGVDAANIPHALDLAFGYLNNAQEQRQYQKNVGLIKGNGLNLVVDEIRKLIGDHHESYK